MKKRFMSVMLVTCLATATIYAGTSFFMKCQPGPEKTTKTEKPTQTSKPSKPCGYESYVSFGGGMFYNQTTGYCRACKKFVYLRWTRKNIPAETKKHLKSKDRPRPKPLGEVWDSQTGKVMTVHACPACKGPFLEIKRLDDLKRCPVCNKSHFAIDKSKPMIAED